MAEYIEREMLYGKAYWHGELPDVGNPDADGVEAVDMADIDAIPAADVVPVRHGRWIKKPGQRCSGRYCSECDCHEPCERNFCPNCGAKMDGD